MAKHSKGKHVQPKAAMKFAKKKEKKNKKENAAGADIGASQTTAKINPVNKGQMVSVGAHAAAPVNVAQPKPEKKPLDKKKVAKRTGFVFLGLLGVLAIFYIVGVIMFSMRFFPNTYIGSNNISLKTPAEVQAQMEDAVGNYTMTVKGQGLNFTISSEDAGLAIDSSGMTEHILKSQNAWAWPAEVFKHRDMAHAMAQYLQASKVAGIVKQAVDNVNANGTDPVNAHIEYDPATKKFSVIPESVGTKLDYETVLEDVFLGAMGLQKDVVLTSKDLIQPTVFKDDKRLALACEQANDMVKANFTLSIDGNNAATVDADTISKWVTVTPDLQATLDENALNQWAAEIADRFDTVGSQRTYTRPDGKVITVKGGDYGWSVDNEALVSSLVEAVKTGYQGNLEIPVLQSGTGFAGLGGRDWGVRYMDVDLSEQHARLYGDNGAIIWESDIVSGAPAADTATPTGVYDVNAIQNGTTLIGYDSNGKKMYETKVRYWMPFVGNVIGFHDADWQSAFGGTRWRDGAGSHGCINLPVSAAKDLMGVLKVGDVVVVHN